MLIITRRIGERLFVNGNEVIIKVTGASGNQVKLGIDAPQDTLVYRKELESSFKVIKN